MNIFLTSLIVLTTLLLYLSIKKPAFKSLFIGGFTLLLIAQVLTTKTAEQFNVSNLESSIAVTRTNEYPTISIKLGSKRIYLPVAHNLEERNLLMIVGITQKNFFEVTDLNSYFFAGHPREGRFKEHYEKFPFIYLFFLFGGLLSSHWREEKIILLSLMAPLVLITFVGNDNPFGPFSLFPFFVSRMSEGLNVFTNLLRRRPHEAF